MNSLETFKENSCNRWETQAICPKTWSWNVSKYYRSDWGKYLIWIKTTNLIWFIPIRYLFSDYIVHDLFPTAMPKHKAWHSMAPSRGANQAWARRAVACKCFQISLSLAGDGACVGSGIDLRPDSDWWPTGDLKWSCRKMMGVSGIMSVSWGDERK